MINNRLIILLIGIFAISNNGFAQPILEWSKNYGGSETDIAYDIEKTSDGGYIMTGLANSENGDASGNNGGQDGWVVKLDSEGSLEWEGNYGGLDHEDFTSIKQTSDGGFIVAGYSTSDDGDVTGNNGEQDSWIVKLDNQGNIEWEKNYGGSGKDLTVDVIQAADNGYALLCQTVSTNGDIGGNYGARDYWLLKLDTDGNLEWERNYGGSAWDTPSSIEAVTTGGYIIAGQSSSDNGDVGGNNGEFQDAWLLKLDNAGNIEWEKNYGGSVNDEIHDLEQTNDQGYILVGRSKSIDGDIEGNNGEYDSWILKLDNQGNIDWVKNYGGTADDEAIAISQTTEGKYFVIGNTESNDGDVSVNNGIQDVWMMFLDEEGNIEWNKNYGSSGFEAAVDVVKITDNEFVVGNWSGSDDGDVPGNNGLADFWAFKIKMPSSSIQSPELNSKVTILPNPSEGECTINISDINTALSVRIIDVLGQAFYRNDEVRGSLNIANLPKGNYFVQIVNGEDSITRKLIVL